MLSTGPGASRASNRARTNVALPTPAAPRSSDDNLSALSGLLAGVRSSRQGRLAPIEAKPAWARPRSGARSARASRRRCGCCEARASRCARRTHRLGRSPGVLGGPQGIACPPREHARPPIGQPSTSDCSAATPQLPDCLPVLRAVPRHRPHLRPTGLPPTSRALGPACTSSGKGSPAATPRRPVRDSPPSGATRAPARSRVTCRHRDPSRSVR